jgi:hypothetical protein
MPRVALLFALLAMVLAGCGSCRNESTAGVSSSQADASVVRDAAPSEVIFDDLLHVVGSRVAVSSKVDNPHDFPEHLIDGRLDTAWNGKTGDLVGGDVAFVVPPLARGRAIDMVVGFTARSRKGEDLFLDNHRIARVRVRRNGEAVLDHAFDVEARGLSAHSARRARWRSDRRDPGDEGRSSEGMARARGL